MKTFLLITQKNEMLLIILIVITNMTNVDRCIQKWRNYDETLRGLRANMIKHNVKDVNNPLTLYDLIHLLPDEKLEHKDCIKVHKWMSGRCCHVLPRWCYELLPIEMTELLHTFDITDKEHAVMQQFNMCELKQQVFKNHFLIEDITEKRYKKNWAFAYLYTKRWGFNTFAIRSKLNHDVLHHIWEYWCDVVRFDFEKYERLHYLYGV